MKNILLITIMVLGIASLSAQEKGKVRVGLDLGYAFASAGGGFLISLEPKYNLTDNSNIGLRLGMAAYGRSLDGVDLSVETNSNYLATYDYYFHKEGSSTAPFLGAGAGFYQLSGFSFIELFSLDGEVKDESKFGVMIRGGVELGRLRLALEYNFVSKTDFGNSEFKNSYLGASIGFYLGGGEWK